MAQVDSSFNANGGTHVAFETITTDQSVGVSVTGKKCGVYGESGDATRGTHYVNDSIANNPGVYGKGVIGVQGQGSRIGVYGEADNFSRPPSTDDKTLPREPSIGVLGRNVHDPTIEKVSEFEAAIAAEAPRQNPALPKSLSSVGLRAYSESNRAGVFYTGADGRPPKLKEAAIVAQIHLRPIKTPSPPVEGEAGDLIAIEVAYGEEVDVQLWFCRKSGGRPGEPAADWKRIKWA